VVNEVGLSGRVSSDPTPLTMNTRGVDSAVGRTPGVGVVRVEPDGWRGVAVDVHVAGAMVVHAAATMTLAYLCEFGALCNAMVAVSMAYRPQNIPKRFILVL